MTDLTYLLPIVILALCLWLGAVTYAFFKLFNHYKRITKRAQSGDLFSLLERVLKKEEEVNASVAKLKEEVHKISLKQVEPIQKVGLVRFNPFNEIGGDQSFSLCLLDGNRSGFIITALHTRDRTRVYTKSVKLGESMTELSQEEKRSLKEALK